MYKHCNLYWTRPVRRDLATYIKGPGEADQGEIEIEPIEYYAYSQYTSNLALFVWSLPLSLSNALFPQS
jgi:hypothetical protein